MTDDANIIDLMNAEIDNANLDVCESLDAHGDTLFLNYRTIHVMVVGWQSLIAIQELFGFESTADLSHLVLWTVPTIDEKAQQILQRQDANGKPLIDIVIVTQKCSEGETATPLTFKDNRFIVSTNTTSCLPWLFLNIVEKVPDKKKLLLVENIHTLSFSNSKQNKYAFTKARDALFECLPQCGCEFPQTKALIERKLFGVP